MGRPIPWLGISFEMYPSLNGTESILISATVERSFCLKMVRAGVINRHKVKELKELFHYMKVL